MWVLCLPFAEVKQKRLLTADQETAFGSEDFKFVLGYPLTDVKLLAFYCPLVAVALAFVYLITSTILQAGFNMMRFLILGILVAPPIFYANMVLGGMLGRALFKSGDKI